jgi:hypothetical protein
MFTAERHIRNFVKSWDMFFECHATATVLELESDPERFASACGRHIAQSLELGMQPAHRRELDYAADDIISALLVQLDAARRNQAARLLLTAALRWSYESLQHNPRVMQLVAHPKPSPLPGWVSERAIVNA